MNDRLEDFINNNKDAFDAFDPNPELWDKVITNEKPKSGRKISLMKIAWRAAAVIAIFIVSYFVHDFISGNENNNSIVENQLPNDCVIPGDIIETEAYYIQQVNVKLSEVVSYTENDPEIQAEIEYDFNELDSIYIELKNDLCDNIDNEEVVDAMIQNYRMKLQILEEILAHLLTINNQENLETDEYQL